MEVKIGAVEGESVDRQTIIDIIKHEEELIKAEKKLKDKELKVQEQEQVQNFFWAELSTNLILKCLLISKIRYVMGENWYHFLNIWSNKICLKLMSQVKQHNRLTRVL